MLKHDKVKPSRKKKTPESVCMVLMQKLKESCTTAIEVIYSIEDITE